MISILILKLKNVYIHCIMIQFSDDFPSEILHLSVLTYITFFVMFHIFKKTSICARIVPVVSETIFELNILLPFSGSSLFIILYVL